MLSIHHDKQLRRTPAAVLHDIDTTDGFLSFIMKIYFFHFGLSDFVSLHEPLHGLDTDLLVIGGEGAETCYSEQANISLKRQTLF